MRQASIPKWMSAFVLEDYRGEVLIRGANYSYIYNQNLSMKKRIYCKFVIISIRVEVIRLVRIRAYKRKRFGKIERVKSHFRRY